MDKISICSWNANSIKNKIVELIEFLDRFDIGILMVNGTKCTKKYELKVRIIPS